MEETPSLGALLAVATLRLGQSWPCAFLSDDWENAFKVIAQKLSLSDSPEPNHSGRLGLGS